MPTADDKNLPLNEDGVWIELRCAALSVPGPVLFLDRDGVVIEDIGYIGDPEAAVLIPGAAALIAHANRMDIPIAIVTNQSGIDRGLFDWAAFAAVTARVDALLDAEDARIDAVAACPFHPDFTPGYENRHARWRKPAPGMIVALASRLNADPAASWMIGDRRRDVEAAAAAKLAGRVLFGNDAGHGEDDGVKCITALSDALTLLSLAK